MAEGGWNDGDSGCETEISERISWFDDDEIFFLVERLTTFFVFLPIRSFGLMK